MRMPPAGAQSLLAAGQPPVPPALPRIDQLVNAARDGSAELAAMRAQIEASRQRVVAADDADQVQLDVLASVSMAGLWANDALPGLSLPGSRPAFTALVGLELEIPLGGSRESAEAARARSELNAAEARYDDRVEALEAEIAAMHIALEAAHEQVALATETASIAADLAEAERQRLALGTKTITDLVRAQQTQRESELRRLRTMVTRSISHFTLEQRTGSLLARYAHAATSEPPP
jgi:outer membrane protein TolC